MARQLGRSKLYKGHLDLKLLRGLGQKKLGEIRIKPNKVLWKPTGAKGKKPWLGVPLDEFIAFMNKTGEPQNK